jgi:hypothetical protein
MAFATLANHHPLNSGTFASGPSNTSSLTPSLRNMIASTNKSGLLGRKRALDGGPIEEEAGAPYRPVAYKTEGWFGLCGLDREYNPPELVELRDSGKCLGLTRICH